LRFFVISNEYEVVSIETEKVKPGIITRSFSVDATLFTNFLFLMLKYYNSPKIIFVVKMTKKRRNKRRVVGILFEKRQIIIPNRTSDKLENNLKNTLELYIFYFSFNNH